MNAATPMKNGMRLEQVAPVTVRREVGRAGEHAEAGEEDLHDEPGHEEPGQREVGGAGDLHVGVSSV